MQSRVSKSKLPPSSGLEIDAMLAHASNGDEPDTLALFANQMKLSLDKTNKLRHAKAIGAVRDEIVKLLSLRWERLNQRTSQLAILVQKDSADDAQDVDEIRGIYTALIQRREVSMGLVRQEEASANDLERSREKDSVMHLTRAKADCEEQRQIVEKLGPGPNPLA